VVGIEDPLGVFHRRFSLDYPKNYLYWETLAKLTSSPGFADRVWRPLIKTNLVQGAADLCVYELAADFIHAACVPPELFLDRTPKRELKRDLKSIVPKVEAMLGALDTLPLGYLQSRADQRTDFASKGRSWDMNKLVANLRGDLKLLQFVFELPDPPRGDVQPTKLNAPRVLATTRARLLKRELRKWSDRPLHGVIAEIVSVLDDADFSEMDVAKA